MRFDHALSYFFFSQWRDRLLLALKEIQDGKLAKKLEDHDYKINGNEERVDDSHVSNLHTLFILVFYFHTKIFSTMAQAEINRLG